jgi:TnpA family transposase
MVNLAAGDTTVGSRPITVDALRQAIATVANGTLHARDPLIWGDGTTACAYGATI